MERNTLVMHASGAIVLVTANILVSLQVFNGFTTSPFEPAHANL